MIGHILKVGILALLVFWLTQNVRPIPRGKQAIVTRLGGVVRVQQDGLLVAWPPPLEHVVVVPVGERQMLENIQPSGADMREKIVVLAGDGGEVALTGSLGWRAGDEAALRAVFDSASVAVAARHTTDEMVRPHGAAVQEIAADVRRNFAALAREGGEAGDGLISINIAALLPVAAESAVADARARAVGAETALAASRAEGGRRLQQTDRDRATLLADARARGAERIAAAGSFTATMAAIEARMSADSRPALLDNLYRERIAAILRQAGSVSTVDPKSVSKVVIPDAEP